MKSRSNTRQFDKMTQTPVKKLVNTLAVPTIISMMVTIIYNLADTYFVSKISVAASGATGIIFGLMGMIQAFGFMYGQGSGSKIARLLAAGKKDDADRILVNVILPETPVDQSLEPVCDKPGFVWIYARFSVFLRKNLRI